MYSIIIQLGLIGFPLSPLFKQRNVCSVHLANVSPVYFFLLDYKAFEEAAEHFQPYIKFFATFDKGVRTDDTSI